MLKTVWNFIISVFYSAMILLTLFVLSVLFFKAGLQVQG